ncbi:MAG: NlpC/P60 family protein [Thermomicrobiales bacterium]
MLPLPAAAEYGIPAGTGAVVTAGQPLSVHSAPGWDSPVSYDVADGSWVTVGGDAIAAPDGSMWYPVDGGYVPVDLVSSAAPAAPADTTFALYEGTDAVTDPNAVPVDSSVDGWIDPTTGQWVTAASQDMSADQQWVDPNAAPVDQSAGWIDPNTGEWVDATQQAPADTWVDPNAAPVDASTDQWVDPNAAPVDAPADTWVDPNAAPVDAPADTWVDPNAAPVDTAVDTWVDPNAAPVDAPVDGWIDPTTGQWVTAAPVVDPNAAPADGYIDPTTGQWVVTQAQEAVEAPVGDATLAAPATTDQWTDQAPADQVWVDPNAVPATDDMTVVDPNAAPVATDVAAPVDAAPDAVTQEWVEPAPVMDNSYGAPIGTAYIAGTNGDGVACRASAERGSEKLATLGEGEAIEVRGEAIGEWQPVNCAGVGGFVNTSYISWEPSYTELAQKGNNKNKNKNRGNAGVDGTATASGQSMVNFAMGYVGYPYAYAGEGPYAFDCSGFTKFVAQNTLGIDITHDMFTQIGMGSSVDRSGLQPGDLVFFANTFRPGLSHTGIYVGDGQFVHAENESTGVVVSDLNSDYYSSRWYGATRLA